MAKGKKSFLLYADLIHTVKKMPEDKVGELFMAILEYVNDMDPVVDDMVVGLVFEPIKQSMKRDLEKYEKRAERSRTNGLKGGRPPEAAEPTGLLINPPEPNGLEVNPDEPTEPDSVSGNVSDSDIKEKEPSPKEKMISWLQGHKELLYCSPTKLGGRPEDIILDDVMPSDKLKEALSGSKDSIGVYLMLTKWMYTEFLNVLGDSKVFRRSKLIGWMGHVRLMVEADERDPEEIVKIFKHAMDDEFWKATIRSTNGVREHFDTVKIQMNAKDERINSPG